MEHKGLRSPEVFSYLNRLLQYLQGKVLGFCCRPSTFSSVGPVSPGPSRDWIDCIIEGDK